MCRRMVIAMEKRPLKTKLSIALDADVVEKIKELAVEDDRSFSSYINRVLRAHINSIEKDNSVSS